MLSYRGLLCFIALAFVMTSCQLPIQPIDQQSPISKSSQNREAQKPFIPGAGFLSSGDTIAYFNEKEDLEVLFELQPAQTETFNTKFVDAFDYLKYKWSIGGINSFFATDSQVETTYYGSQNYPVHEIDLFVSISGIKEEINTPEACKPIWSVYVDNKLFLKFKTNQSPNPETEILYSKFSVEESTYFRDSNHFDIRMRINNHLSELSTNPVSRLERTPATCIQVPIHDTPTPKFIPFGVIKFFT